MSDPDPTAAALQIVGNVATVAGLYLFTATGAKAINNTYQATASPYTSLTESEKKLKRVESRLQGLSVKQREEIEATQHTTSNDESFKSIEDLEQALEGLFNVHCRLSNWYEDANVWDRHRPFTQFRRRVAEFERNAKGLLHDTLKTTVPCIDDINFGTSDDSRRAMARPANSHWQSPAPADAVTTPSGSGLPADAVVIPMTPIVPV